MNNFELLNISEQDMLRVKQHCSNVDTDSPIGFEFDGMWITNIFLDSSGRFEYSLVDAIKEYGIENIQKFVASII